MPNPRLAIFDAYGTLFDVHSAVAKLAAPLGTSATRVSELWRQKQLEYTWTRSLMNRYADFWQVTEEALDYALAACGCRDASVRAKLLEAYRALDAYPEVRETLVGYRESGFRVAVFSNGTTRMITDALVSAKLDDVVDCTCSVDAQGVYKPAASVYAQIAKDLQATAPQIVFHSSNAWDAAGAASCGWHVLWINRTNQPREYPWLPVTPLASLRDALTHARTQWPDSH